MEINKIHRVYFLGIGGIGMSALARYFATLGKEVSGYDRTSTELTTALVQEGIPVHFTEEVEAIPENIDLVIYTPAIPVDHKEYQYFLSHSILMVKRSEVLGWLSQNLHCIAISGTHGKTSISCMTTHLLKQAAVPVNGFIGGISVNYHTNLILTENAHTVVVEADEYDRSFLRLQPDIAVVSAVDADHLDIYKTHEALKSAFAEFISKIRTGGTLIINAQVDLPLATDKKVVTYGGAESDYRAENIRVEAGSFVFNLVGPAIKIEDIHMEVPGKHNVENALAASAAAHLTGLNAAQIKQGLETYKGVKRRFEFICKTRGSVYVDDYAHHPEEIKACIGAARALFPGRKITGIFQPHLFSRTRDFATGFSEALSLLDEVVLLPIYPAREMPIPGVNSEMLMEQITCKEKACMEQSEVESWVNTSTIDVLITMGAGDIDKLVEKIKVVIEQKEQAQKK